MSVSLRECDPFTLKDFSCYHCKRGYEKGHPVVSHQNTDDLSHAIHLKCLSELRIQKCRNCNATLDLSSLSTRLKILSHRNIFLGLGKSLGSLACGGFASYFLIPHVISSRNLFPYTQISLTAIVIIASIASKHFVPEQGYLSVNMCNAYITSQNLFSFLVRPFYDYPCEKNVVFNARAVAGLGALLSTWLLHGMKSENSTEFFLGIVPSLVAGITAANAISSTCMDLYDISHIPWGSAATATLSVLGGMVLGHKIARWSLNFIAEYPWKNRDVTELPSK
ncbi:MAG: hypothetical protein K1000chlam3_00011 [Chlamydiae bacterium]|nr:hypothetical protein [Chlamydiota bacterium]